jgi:hypothetical protein
MLIPAVTLKVRIFDFSWAAEKKMESNYFLDGLNIRGEFLRAPAMFSVRISAMVAAPT